MQDNSSNSLRKSEMTLDRHPVRPGRSTTTGSCFRPRGQRAVGSGREAATTSCQDERGGMVRKRGRDWTPRGERAPSPPGGPRLASPPDTPSRWGRQVHRGGGGSSGDTLPRVQMRWRTEICATLSFFLNTFERIHLKWRLVKELQCGPTNMGGRRLTTEPAESIRTAPL
jgi:hypothetical protein